MKPQLCGSVEQRGELLAAKPSSDGFGFCDHQAEDLLLGLGGVIDRGAASNQQHLQRLTLATAARSSQPRSSHRLAGGTDRIERIRLRPVAARSRLRAVQLDDDLRDLQQVPTQASTVAAGPLDRPGPQRRVVTRELHQLGITLGCRLDGDLVEDTTSRGVHHGRGVGMDVGVDADDDIDHLAQIGQTGHAFSPSPDGTWFRSGTEARQDCDETRPAVLRQVVKLLIRPAPPTGPGPATTSGQVAPRHKASHSGGYTRGHQPTAQHHQAAYAILTVISPRMTVKRKPAMRPTRGSIATPTPNGVRAPRRTACSPAG